MPILATKLYIPPVRSKSVLRPGLIERLNVGLTSGCRVTIVSAAAGFGKTTLISMWLAERKRPAAWLSLDEADNDPVRFLTYLVAALQTVAPEIGAGVQGVLQAPQPPPAESILTILLNEITSIPDPFILVLDDYHVIDSRAVDEALVFLIEHLPPQLHLVLATREDPNLPLARLRARGQLAELRAADLRFSPAEAAGFLNQMMGLNLTTQEIAALESRTEGWIAGLQLAAISMQGHQDTGGFIESFTGSHHFILDYLLQEVLDRQPENVRAFLLRSSILDRLCGPLCEAMLGDPSVSGQETLAYLERTNLFIVPLDNERRWYRYHHLFAELLRQRASLAAGKSGRDATEDRIRASQWLEDNGLEIEAFQQAAAANDVERAERLIQGEGIPRHFRGAVMMILEWLAALPPEVMNARPSLWWRQASLLLVNGQTTGVEEKLLAAEAGLPPGEADATTRNMIGRIATARATLALTRYDTEGMLVQSRRALEYLSAENLSLRANAYWTLGFAHLLKGERLPARQGFDEAVLLSQAAGDVFTTILAMLGLGNLQEAANELYPAAGTYRRVLELAGDQPLQIMYEAHLGMGRILYEWNELDAAREHGEESLRLARQYEHVIDRFIICEVFLARLKLAEGDVTGAAAILARADQSIRQNNFIHRTTEVAAQQVRTLLRQGNLAAAAHLAEAQHLPIGQARVYLAQGNPSAALFVLEPLRQQMEAQGWEDERLKIIILQALGRRAKGENRAAIALLVQALTLAEPGGFLRIFLDEGAPMAQLLAEATASGVVTEYSSRLLEAFKAEQQREAGKAGRPGNPTGEAPVEPLSPRELEVLQLIAQGLSNREIGARLFLALSTVKGHSRIIFDKLQVQRRTEAVARARELGLL